MIMTAADRFVGIDISQGRLEVAVTPGDQTLSHPNTDTEAGIQKLVHRLSREFAVACPWRGHYRPFAAYGPHFRLTFHAGITKNLLRHRIVW